VISQLYLVLVEYSCAQIRVHVRSLIFEFLSTFMTYSRHNLNKPEIKTWEAQKIPCKRDENFNLVNFFFLSLFCLFGVVHLFWTNIAEFARILILSWLATLTRLYQIWWPILEHFSYLSFRLGIFMSLY